MGIINWYNKQIKKLNVFDIAAVKTVSFLIGLIVGAYAVSFVKSYLWIIVILTVLLMVMLLFKVFKK